MKKILWALIPLIAISLALTGCRGKVVDVTVLVKNVTNYEIRWVVFNIPQSSGTYSPMHNIITSESDPLNPGDEREAVTWLYDSDFGNAGIALIGLKDDGSSDSLNTAKGAIVLERRINHFVITYHEEAFVITAVDAEDYANTPVSENNKTADNHNMGTSPAPENEFTLTLLAGFVGEVWMDETVSLPVENEPASSSAIAFYLADELSARTGFDFTLNDVSFGEDSVTVDWSKDSTLIAGLDNREQKEEFHFFDAVYLNWFIMDSLAMTLQYNLDITTVYYCSDGGSVTFSNREDMADQGLPELPADQPYEGSAFFINNASGRGDLIPIDKDQAEYIVKEATKIEALDIEAAGNMPAYVYKGEGEIGGDMAWYFDLEGSNTQQYRYAVNEWGELWGMDTFGKWQFLPAK